MSASETNPVPALGLKLIVASKVPADSKAIAITYFIVFKFVYFLVCLSLDCWRNSWGQPGEIPFGLLDPFMSDPFMSLTPFSGNGGAKFSKRVQIFPAPPIPAIGTDIDF